MKDSLILTPFQEALHSLKLALEQPNDQLTEVQKQMFKDSVIQRFEYTYELAWRLMKRVLEAELEQPLDEVGRRDLFRRAFEFGLIENPEPWFRYQDARNKSSHAYDQKIAQEVYEIAAPFAHDAQQLMHQLEKRYGISPSQGK